MKEICGVPLCRSIPEVYAALEEQGVRRDSWKRLETVSIEEYRNRLLVTEEVQNLRFAPAVYFFVGLRKYEYFYFPHLPIVFPHAVMRDPRAGRHRTTSWIPGLGPGRQFISVFARKDRLATR